MIINGAQISAEIREEIKRDVEHLHAERGFVPGLSLLLVGEDPASQVYVRNKSKMCEEVGIVSEIVRMPATSSEAEVLHQVRLWNDDPTVHGILVQLPLPKHINEHRVIEAIAPSKDVDGFHPENAGRLMIGLPGFIPCTPAGIVELIARTGVDTNGAHAVVVGRSNIVGKPIANLLAQKRPHGNATVTLCHTATRDLAAMTRQADILIAAVGVAHIITGDHVREGVVVIDVGMNRITLADGTSKLTGDVEFATVEPKAHAITPVPRGVGPMTIAMLLKNTMLAARGELYS